MTAMFIVYAPDNTRRRASVELAATDDKARAATLAREAGANSVIVCYPATFGEPAQARLWTGDIGGRKWAPAVCPRQRYVLHRPGWTTAELSALDGDEAMAQAARLQRAHELPRSVRIDEYHGVPVDTPGQLVRRWFVKDGVAHACRWMR